MGIEMQPDETAIRANLVALSDEGEPYEEKRMLDHSADEIPTGAGGRADRRRAGRSWAGTDAPSMPAFPTGTA